MPFIHPLQPILQDIKTDPNIFIVTTVKTQQKELIWSFKEVLYVEDSLQKQIITSSDANYITALRDCNTKSIKNSISITRKHLFNTYGKIKPQIFTQPEDVFKQMDFDVDTPINTVRTTLSNWEISLPYISIPTPTISISNGI